MRTALMAMGTCLAVLLGNGCASTEIVGVRDSQFRDTSYHDVVVMARSGDLIREKKVEEGFVRYLSKRHVQARTALELLPPTRKWELPEAMKELQARGASSLLLIGLKEQWADTYFKDGTSYSVPREKSGIDLIDVPSGRVAWTASTFSGGDVLADDNAMISSLVSRISSTLIKEGIVLPQSEVGGDM